MFTYTWPPEIARYSPVALRFMTYSIPIGDQAREFLDAVQGLISVRPERKWYAEYWDLIESLDYPFFKGAALSAG